MKRIINTFLLAVVCCLTAWAGDNKLSIAEFQLSPGDEKELEIGLTNEDDMSVLQFDVTFPKGLTYDVKSLSKVTARITRSSHSVFAEPQSSTNGMRYRFGVLSSTNAIIKGNSGAILTIKVKAAADYTGGVIRVDSIEGSNGNLATPVPYLMPDFNVNAGVKVGSVAVDTTSLPLYIGQPAVVNVALNNIIALSALQAKVTLPEGLEFAKDAEGAEVSYTDRWTEQHYGVIGKPDSNNGYKLVVAANPNSDFAGNSGNLFGLNVVAKEGYKGGDIKISDFIVSNMLGAEYRIDTTLVVNCPNANVADNEKGMEQLLAVLTEAQTAYSKADLKIADECPHVSEEYAAKLLEVGEPINTIGNEAAEKYEAGTITNEYVAEAVAKIKDVLPKLDSIVALAVNAEAAYMKKAANDTAYVKLNAEVAELTKALDAAKAQVKEECKDVEASFADVVAAIVADIDSLQKDLNAKNDTLGLTAESALDAQAVKAVNDAIAKYVADAKAAQAAVEANEKGNADILAALAELQKAYGIADSTIAADCAAVKEEYLTRLQEANASAATIGEEAAAKHEAGEITAEYATETIAKVNGISAKFDEILSAAKAAQAQYDADKKAYEEKVAMNDSVYKKLSAEIAASQARLDEVKRTIEDEYSEVASQFSGTELTIQLELNKVAKELKAQYDNMELTETSSVDLSILNAAIEQLLADAKKAYETTGIAGTDAGSHAECTGIYTLGGAKVETPAKGNTYIFRYADGRVRKVHVK